MGSAFKPISVFNGKVREPDVLSVEKGLCTGLCKFLPAKKNKSLPLSKGKNNNQGNGKNRTIAINRLFRNIMVRIRSITHMLKDFQ